MLHKDVSLEDKSNRNTMTKKESISWQNLKHIGRGSLSLASYKKKHLTQDPILIQARLGLNKTGKTENPGSNIVFDKAKSKLSQAGLKIHKDKDVGRGEMFQSKPQMAKSTAGNQTSGLANRLQSNPSHDSQLKPSSEFAKDHEGVLSPKKSNIGPSSTISKALKSVSESHTCPITGVFQKLKSHGPVDIPENSKTYLLDLNTNDTVKHTSSHYSKGQLEASETDISTLSQIKQTDHFRFPLKSHGSSTESSLLAKNCNPESETTTSNYIYTPQQLNQTDQFPLKSRTCRRVIKGPGSFSDRKSTYLISAQARKKDSSSKETGRKGSQKKIVLQKSKHCSNTDPSKLNSSQTNSLEEDTHLEKDKHLEAQKMYGISCSTQSTGTHTAKDTWDDAVIQIGFHSLPNSGSPQDLCDHSHQQKHTAIPKLFMGDWMPRSGADKGCEQSLTEGDSLTVEQVNFPQLHQQDDSLLRKPSVSEERKSKQVIIHLPDIYALTREYKPNDL